MHEVLVHAAAVTTFQADQQYLRQSIACIDFCAAVRHTLSDVQENTPEGQILVKPVTPSTTTTDRSDVVPDSQRIRRSKPVYVAAQEAVSKVGLSQQYATGSLRDDGKATTHVTLKSTMENSHRLWLEHEQSLQDVSAISSHAPTHPEYTFGDVSDYRPTATPRHQSMRETETTVIDKIDETTAYPTPTAFKAADTSTTSVLSARQALDIRESLALKRRRTTYRGLTQLFQATQAEFQHSTPLPASHRVGKLHNADPPIIDDHSKHDGSVDVDRYITVASTEVYGSTVSPISEGHTSAPSDRTGRASIEHDIVSDRTRSQSRSQRSTQHILADANVDKTNSGQPNTFVIAQLQSPFYDPTFSLSQASPIGIHCSGYEQGVLQSTPSLQHINNPAAKPSTIARQIVPEIVPDTIVRRDDRRLLEKPLREFAKNDQSRDFELDQSGTALKQQTEPIAVGLASVNPQPTSQPLSSITSNHVRERHSQTKDFSASIPVNFAAGLEIFHLIPTSIDSELTTESDFLKSLKTPKKVRHRKRDLRPLERGYWSVDLKSLEFSSADTRKLWKDLVMIITRRVLRWVSLQYCANVIRVYCFGHDAMAVWTMLYAVSKKVKRGIHWIDASGEQIIAI